MEYSPKTLPTESILNGFRLILAEIIPTVDPITVSLKAKSVLIDTDEVDTKLVYEMLCVYMAGHKDAILPLLSTLK